MCTNNLKETNKYFFTVEGDTELWYLKYLERLINGSEQATNKVSFKIGKESPCKYIKKLSILKKEEVYHFFDYESSEEEYKKRFKLMIDDLKTASCLGKNIVYKLGYSNLTFDLWMILHKSDCNGSIAERKQYLTYLNKGYDEDFNSMKHYKKEDGFNKCLYKINLNDVINAINRAKNIINTNQKNGYKVMSYKKYEYYEENPSLSIHNCIEKILRDCKILN